MWKKYDRITLSNGEFIRFELIKKNEYEFLKETESLGELTQEFSKKGLFAFQINNQRILCKNIDYHAIFRSKSDLSCFLEENNNFQSEHILFNRNPYEEKFPQKTEELIKEFLKSMEIDYKPPYTNQLLKLLDSKLYGLENAFEILDDFFLNIVALVGEVILWKENGVWGIELDDDRMTWYPFIIKSNGKRSDFTISLAEFILCDQSYDDCSLLDVYIMESYDKSLKNEFRLK